MFDRNMQEEPESKIHVYCKGLKRWLLRKEPRYSYWYWEKKPVHLQVFRHSDKSYMSKKD